MTSSVPQAQLLHGGLKDGSCQLQKAANHESLVSMARVAWFLSVVVQVCGHVTGADIACVEQQGAHMHWPHI